FHFCDITYNFDSFGDLFSGSSGWQQIERELQGKSSEPIETIKATIGHREYRYVEPGRLRQVYQRDCDGRRLAVIRRRGFGQYALAEFPDRSIGVFVHRGDSPGESGSN